MLKLKDYIMPNVGVFFRYKNNVDVFVEDNYDQEFYLVLINRVFDATGHKINKLLPLGSKRNVLNACETDQSKRSIKRLYIVDGDLDIIENNNDKKLKHLFVLEKYCIENYLIQEDAIIEILHDILVIDRGKIKSQLSYQNWLKGISKPMIELFLHYAISKEVCPTEATISLGVGNLCKEVKNVTVLDDTKCYKRIEEIKINILKSISEEEYNEQVYNLRNTWVYNIDTLLRIVSGKDYLLPLVEFRFQKFKRAKIRRNSLRLRLAKLIEVKELERMKDKIG